MCSAPLASLLAHMLHCGFSYRVASVQSEPGHHNLLLQPPLGRKRGLRQVRGHNQSVILMFYSSVHSGEGVYKTCKTLCKKKMVLNRFFLAFLLTKNGTFYKQPLTKKHVNVLALVSKEQWLIFAPGFGERKLNG